MNISFAPEIERFIQSQIESGKYSSALELILEGIRLLQERERIYKGRFEKLKQEIAIGIEAAERGEIIDGETVIHQLQKLQQRRSQAEQ